MRLAVVVIGILGMAGCYDQPRIPKDQPLSCTRTDADPEKDCPTGYSCLGQICAPQSCRESTDCPLGTYCLKTGRGGCQLLTSDAGGDVVPIPIGPTVPGDPGTGDAGADALADAGGN